MPALVAGIGVWGGASKQSRRTKSGRDGGGGSNPLPLAGEGREGSAASRLAQVAKTYPHPLRFHLRAPRFGGLEPSVARKASVGGSLASSPVNGGGKLFSLRLQSRVLDDLPPLVH